MKRLKQDLIEKLRNGEIAVRNDGSSDELKAVLKEAFPLDKFNDDTSPFECMENFHKDNDSKGFWFYDAEDLPSVSVKDFFEDIFNNGDDLQCLVNDEWLDCIYIGKNPHMVEPDNSIAEHVVLVKVDKGYELSYATNIRRKPKEEINIEISVKINGKEAKLSDISEDTLNKIKELENGTK